MVILINSTALANRLSLIVKSTKQLVRAGYYQPIPIFLPIKSRRTIVEGILTSGNFPVLAELKFTTPNSRPFKESSLQEAKSILDTYTSSSVCGLSILTEPNFFRGSLAYLNYASVTVASHIPILMKDFIIDPVQIDCAKRYGASSILLITRILTDDIQQELIEYAHKLHLEVLLEVNTKQELEKALQSKADILGINNRNLSSMEISLKTTEDLLLEVDKNNKLILSLSGINTAEDAIRMKRAGADGILVGSALMSSPDPTLLINQLSKI